MLTAVIVDDEPLARQRLRRLLGKVAGTVIQVVAECTDVDELMRLAQRTQVDVLFLDIELPGGNGFTALRRWNGPPPKVVFVSAYDQHGVRAFEDRAVDYLLKPVSAERLRDTVSRLAALPDTPPRTGDPRPRPALGSGPAGHGRGPGTARGLPRGGPVRPDGGPRGGRCRTRSAGAGVDPGSRSAEPGSGSGYGVGRWPRRRRG